MPEGYGGELDFCDAIIFTRALCKWSNSRAFSVLDRDKMAESPLDVDAGEVDVVRPIGLGVCVALLGCREGFCVLHPAFEWIERLCDGR